MNPLKDPACSLEELSRKHRGTKGRDVHSSPTSPVAIVFQMALKNEKVFSFSVCSSLLYILNIYHNFPFLVRLCDDWIVCWKRGKDFSSFYVFSKCVYTFSIFRLSVVSYFFAKTIVFVLLMQRQPLRGLLVLHE